MTDWSTTLTNQTTTYVDQTAFDGRNLSWQYHQWDYSQPTPKEQPEMQLYEYAVIYLPEDDEGNIIYADARIVTQPTTRLARNEEQVRRQAIHELGVDVDLDFVVVQVRPFGGR